MLTSCPTPRPPPQAGPSQLSTIPTIMIGCPLTWTHSLANSFPLSPSDPPAAQLRLSPDLPHLSCYDPCPLHFQMAPSPILISSSSHSELDPSSQGGKTTPAIAMTSYIPLPFCSSWRRLTHTSVYKYSTLFGDCLCTSLLYLRSPISRVDSSDHF